MPEKTLAPYRGPRAPSSKTLARQADALSARILSFLSGQPALTAASVLADMLRDTSDPATRLAILTTRIQVLRARTIACRLGRPVDREIKLGKVLEELNSTPLPPEILDPSQAPSEPAPTPPADTAAEALVQLQLRESYTHEGFALPQGAVFATTLQAAQDLVKHGIASHLPPGGATEPDADPQTDPKIDADAAPIPALKPYEPETPDRPDTDTAEDPGPSGTS